MPFPLGSLPERWRPHAEASPASGYASNTRGPVPAEENRTDSADVEQPAGPSRHTGTQGTSRAGCLPRITLRPTAQPMMRPLVVAKATGTGTYTPPALAKYARAGRGWRRRGSGPPKRTGPDRARGVPSGLTRFKTTAPPPQPVSAGSRRHGAACPTGIRLWNSATAGKSLMRLMGHSQLTLGRCQ
jgi:hypothetical protein